MVGSFSDYDMISASKRFSIEFKCETTPARTGNVAIEYWNTDLDAPSGILGTKANTWIHLVPKGDHLEAMELDVNRLRKLVLEESRVESNGRNSLCRIIPLERFKAVARRCFDVQTRFMSDIMEGAASRRQR
ncbi:MAG: hypothetical protein WB626_05045 [Bacteroidota bacterium]